MFIQLSNHVKCDICAHTHTHTPYTSYIVCWIYFHRVCVYQWRFKLHETIRLTNICTLPHGIRVFSPVNQIKPIRFNLKNQINSFYYFFFLPTIFILISCIHIWSPPQSWFRVWLNHCENKSFVIKSINLHVNVENKCTYLESNLQHGLYGRFGQFVYHFTIGQPIIKRKCMHKSGTKWQNPDFQVNNILNETDCDHCLLCAFCLILKCYLKRNFHWNFLLFIFIGAKQ